MNPLLYFNNDPVKVFKHFYIRYNQILFRGDYQKIYEQYENIVFTLPSLAAAIIFGVFLCIVSESSGYEMFYEEL